MSNPIDTNQASELMELCKEVYEKTGWIVGDESWDWHTTTDAKLDSMFIAPKYYTDYLLEKLPKELENHFLVVEICNAHNELEWTADYYNHRYSTYLVSDEPSKADTTHGETPLKALLKLTIALSEAGELK